jgi:hypothetical protein
MGDAGLRLLPCSLPSKTGPVTPLGASSETEPSSTTWPPPCSPGSPRTSSGGFYTRLASIGSRQSRPRRCQGHRDVPSPPSPLGLDPHHSPYHSVATIGTFRRRVVTVTVGYRYDPKRVVTTFPYTFRCPKLDVAGSNPVSRSKKTSKSDRLGRRLADFFVDAPVGARLSVARVG